METAPSPRPLFQLLALIGAAGSLLTGCATPQISRQTVAASDPAAVELVRASQDAHGRAAFRKVHDVSVRYTGKWAPIGPRFQPVLADTAFRRNSEERWLADSRMLAQVHTGPAGKKVVLRPRGAVTVAYNGALAQDEESRRAAALVADAYTLFLLGPFYFDRPGVKLTQAGEGVVDRARCDQVLAVLRPGFGMAEEDRVVLSIDRGTRQLRRVRMTLSGLESTQGAEVDVTFRKFQRIGGVLWPTDFDERIRVPFKLHAHHWKMRGLDLNRGLSASDFRSTGFGGSAARPAADLPASETTD